MAEGGRPLEMAEEDEVLAQAIPLQGGGLEGVMRVDVPSKELDAGVQRNPRPSRKLVQWLRPMILSLVEWTALWVRQGNRGEHVNPLPTGTWSMP